MSRLARLRIGAVGIASLAPLALLTTANFATQATSVSTQIPVVPMAVVGPMIASKSKTTVPPPPTPNYCLTTLSQMFNLVVPISCYSPADMAAQYNFPAASTGITGKGQTIVIFDSFGSPTIRQDLTTFDNAFHIQPPPSFAIYNPEGAVTFNYTHVASPADFHNKNIGTEIGWAYETTLDVEWAHAMAPGANIALVTVPIPETQGVQGLQNLENAQRWALTNKIGTIWSDSFATTEQAFQTPSTVISLDKLYQQAAAQGVSVFFASGDTGVLNTNKQGIPYPYPTVNFPSSSPYVISVGGTEITNPPATAITSYQGESVWNDTYGAGGGGYSSIFGETTYQNSAQISDPSAMRGLPDVSYNAAVISSVLIWESFDPSGSGWIEIGGTSAATPQWAAVTALINQADGPQGFIAPKLYNLATNPSNYAGAFHDIVAGNNSFFGITGYSATSGWDAASGLGTPNVSGLISKLG